MQARKILSGNRIRLPDDFLSKFSLDQGSLVIIESTDTGLLVFPAELRRKG